VTVAFGPPPIRWTAQLIAEPVLGGWCPTCNLPSLMECEYVVSRDRATHGVMQTRRCLDGCGLDEWRWKRPAT